MNLLFDLDGTIGNTLPLCIQAFREAIEPLSGRLVTDSQIVAQFGPSEEGTIQALIPSRYAEGVERYIESYARLHKYWPDPFDGIPEILSHLKTNGNYVGMVTGKGARSTQITLKSYHLGNFFNCVKTGSIHGPVKKERIEEVIRESGIPRTDFMYIGDAPGDITAARNCRIQIGAAAWAPGSDPAALAALNPDYLFRTIREFEEFILTIA